ncbi:hypothetical protein FGD77_03200 [Roseovarius sp. M141]|nr:hypothetical protein [Roseovarius sp. M141]
MSKVADGLIDPKLVLSWLLSHLGASSFFVGLLVPIREAGALLPQLFTAPRVQAMARRKWAWVAGSIGQGAAAAGIVLAAVSLSGAAAGVVICASLAVLAVARSVCSVSYSDVLGKTVGQSRRGAATGTATSLGAGAVVIFALLLISGVPDRATLVIAAIALAALLWLGAGFVFSTLWEEPAPGERRAAALGQLNILRCDPQLTRFIWARGLLTSTALAPPYIVLLGAQAGQGTFDRLGALVLASSIASFISSWVWGRLADRSSRRVLMFSGMVGALALLAAVAVDLAGGFRYHLGAARGAVRPHDRLSRGAAGSGDLSGGHGPKRQPRDLYGCVKYGDRDRTFGLGGVWGAGVTGGCQSHAADLCLHGTGVDLCHQGPRRYQKLRVRWPGILFCLVHVSVNVC